MGWALLGRTVHRDGAGPPSEGSGGRAKMGNAHDRRPDRSPMNNVRPLLCLLIIAGIGPTAHTDAQRAAGRPPSGGPPIAVAEQRPITLADHEQILGLSPEGGRLLVLRGDEICI